jgi:hypothetical protein
MQSTISRKELGSLKLGSKVELLYGNFFKCLNLAIGNFSTSNRDIYSLLVYKYVCQQLPEFFQGTNFTSV